MTSKTKEAIAEILESTRGHFYSYYFREALAKKEMEKEKK